MPSAVKPASTSMGGTATPWASSRPRLPISTRPPSTQAEMPFPSSQATLSTVFRFFSLVIIPRKMPVSELSTLHSTLAAFRIASSMGFFSKVLIPCRVILPLGNRSLPRSRTPSVSCSSSTASSFSRLARQRFSPSLALRSGIWLPSVAARGEVMHSAEVKMETASNTVPLARKYSSSAITTAASMVMGASTPLMPSVMPVSSSTASASSGRPASSSVTVFSGCSGSSAAHSVRRLCGRVRQATGRRVAMARQLSRWRAFFTSLPQVLKNRISTASGRKILFPYCSSRAGCAAIKLPCSRQAKTVKVT